MFYVKRLAFSRDSLLYRDDMHSDSGSARSHHLSDPRKRQICHSLKEIRDLRSLTHDLIPHYHDLCRSRYELVENVTSLMLRILAILVLIVPLDETELAQSLQNCLQMIVIIACQFFHLFESPRLALSHLQGCVKTILGDVLAVSSDDVLISAVKSPILRRIL